MRACLRACVRACVCVCVCFIVQHLCESRGGRSWAVRPKEPYGFRGRKATLNHASVVYVCMYVCMYVSIYLSIYLSIYQY